MHLPAGKAAVRNRIGWSVRKSVFIGKNSYKNGSPIMGCYGSIGRRNYGRRPATRGRAASYRSESATF
jgi:hypothetical protein